MTMKEIESAKIVMLPVDSIVYDTGLVNETQAEWAAESMKEYGMTAPLIVARHSEEYVLLSGATRLAAAIRAGFKEVPVYVRETC